MVTVNYIVANYIGPLRRYPHYQELFSKDPLFFLKKHIDLVTRVTDVDITATFVYNDDLDTDLKKEIERYSRDKIEIVFRKNSGFSYGIWNDTVKNNIDKYDYFFLIEDDYIPCSPEFLRPFIKRTSEKVSFVCGLVETASKQRFPLYVPESDGSFKFPSISNGLLTASSCKIVLDKTGNIFNINSNSDYHSAYKNQIYFCKYFTDMGFDITDILDQYSSPYNNATDMVIKFYGNPNNPSLLKPIEF